MKVGVLRWAIMLMACFVVNTGFAEVYKWVDDKGKVHFGDRPPAKSQAVELDLPESKEPPATTVSDLERKRRQQRLVKALEEERREKERIEAEKKRKKEQRIAKCRMHWRK